MGATGCLGGGEGLSSKKSDYLNRLANSTQKELSISIKNISILKKGCSNQRVLKEKRAEGTVSYKIRLSAWWLEGWDN